MTNDRMRARTSKVLRAGGGKAPCDSTRITHRFPGVFPAGIAVAALAAGFIISSLSPPLSNAAQPAVMAFSENNGFEHLLVGSGEFVQLTPNTILRESQVISNIAVDNSGESPTYFLLGIGRRKPGQITAEAVRDDAVLADTHTLATATKIKSPPVTGKTVDDDRILYLQSWQHPVSVDLTEVADNGLLGYTCISMHFDQQSQQLVLWSWLPPIVNAPLKSKRTSNNRTSHNDEPAVDHYLGTVAHIDRSGKFTVVYQSDLVAPPGADHLGSMRACHSRWNPQTAALAVMAQTPDQRAVRQIQFRIRPGIAITCDKTYPHQPGVLTGEEQISSDNTGRLFWIPSAVNTDSARAVYSFAPDSCEKSTPPEFIASLPVKYQHKFGRCQTVIANDKKRLLVVAIGPKQATAANLLTLDLDTGQVVNAPTINLPDAQALGNCVAVQ